MKTWLALAAALGALSSCVPRVHWQPSAGLLRSSSGFSITLPPGWMVLAQGANSTSGFVAASRDGPSLQCIAAGATGAPGNESPAISALKAWQRMPLYTTADSTGNKNAALVAATLGGEATPPVVEPSSPTVVGGRLGFRAEVKWNDPTGLPVRSVVLGAIVGPRLYWLLYAAPARHYFDLDLATFDEVARTFHIEPAGEKPVQESSAPGY